MTDKIIEVLNKTENCSIIDDVSALRNKSLKAFAKVISVDTEITFNGKLLELRLYVGLPKKLEVELPKIFIDEDSYTSLKYIPHINSDHSICIQDESENYYYSSLDLPDITLHLIQRAKEILRSKEDISYTKAEFQREFQAYWSIEYSKKDKVNFSGLSLVDDCSDEEVKAIKLKTKIGHYEFVIYNSSIKFDPFIRYLKQLQVAYVDVPLFQIDYGKEEPSYELSYFSSIEYLKLSDKNILKKAINQSKGNDLLVIFKNNHSEFYGWLYPKFNILPPGYRQKSNWEKLALNHAKNFAVERIAFSDITPERLSQRTEGDIRELSNSVNVVGLGSVGSNLLHFLSKIPIKKYHLVDNDIYKVENVYRSNFGFSFVSSHKSEVAKYQLLDKNPFVDIVTHEQNIIKVLEVEPCFFEQSDYTFLIVGVRRIEEYLIDYLIANNSQKPIFILWVEPYLASGQMMYITPSKFKEAKSLLSNYPYHVISDGENLFLKEGSCQSGYYPYSETYLLLFLSQIFPYIYEIIVKKDNTNSKIFSWVGDIDFLRSKKGISIEPKITAKPFSLTIFSV